MRALSRKPNRWLYNDLFKEFDHFFDGGYENALTGQRQSFIQPHIEIEENDDFYLLHVEVPGVDEKDLQIEIANGNLFLKGDKARNSSEVNEDGSYKFVKKTVGSFSRSFLIPENVDQESIEAKQENGILNIYLPKTQASQPRTVKIEKENKGIFEKLFGSSESK